MEFEKLWETFGRIEGWLSKEEARLLFETAKRIPDNGVIVEIGSWKGKSTIFLATGSRTSGRAKIYAIDPHRGDYTNRSVKSKLVSSLGDFKNNINNAQVDDLIVPVAKKSEDAAKGWNKKINLLFIDGLHDYESVKKDYLLWSKYLVPGGRIMFHDAYCGHEGVARLVQECVVQNGDYSDFEIAGSILSARKSKPKNFSAKLNLRRFRLFFNLSIVLTNSAIVKLMPRKVIFLIFHKILKIFL